MLTFDFGPKPHHVIANVPFSLTTPLLRRLLQQNHWDTAVLLLQWEVARKRAGVGGTTMLTASWWPWYEFSLGKRVPAAAFTPMPTVDGGILIIRRRAVPLVPSELLKDYQYLVRQAFTGPGHGLRVILWRHFPDRIVDDWMSRSASTAEPCRVTSNPTPGHPCSDSTDNSGFREASRPAIPLAL